jgi:RNA polymerase sigma-70 factor, ECF subfamily
MTHEASYQTLVEPHRAELHAHCYRMLGSAQDAEDALQEALTNAWRALPRFEGRSSVRSWLYKIATNACLKLIERRPKRVLPIDYGPASDPHDAPSEPLAESIWVDPFPDSRLGLGVAVAGPEARYEERESVELAFIAALQHIAPKQRAVLILRDVLGFTAGEVAETLDATTTSVYSALQRAHRTIDERLPDQSQQATLAAIGDERLRAIADRYIRAWESGDVDAIVSLLADDATITMPPRPTWYHGRDAVAGFLRTYPLASHNDSLLVPAGVNAQLAFGHYFRDAATGRYLPHGINVLTLRGPLIADITTFLTPEDFVRLGLPDELPRAPLPLSSDR